MDKIRQKIKELRELLDDHNYYLDNSEQALGYSAALDDIEKFLDTLSEEPSKSLEEAADKHIRSVVDAAGHPGWDWTTQDIADAFIAGAEWQKSQMLKEAVEVTVQSPLLGPPMVCCIANGCSDGDKVRIIIVKEDEK